MKILMDIDQRRSLIAGHEAPNSTEVIEIPVSDISEATRETILPFYDLKTGRFHVVLKNDLYIPAPSIVAPLTQESVIKELDLFAERVRVAIDKVQQEEQEMVSGWIAEAQKVIAAKEVRRWDDGRVTPIMPSRYGSWGTHESIKAILESQEYLDFVKYCEQEESKAQEYLAQQQAERKAAKEEMQKQKNAQIEDILKSSGDPAAVERWKADVMGSSEFDKFLVSGIISKTALGLYEIVSYTEHRAVPPEYWKSYREWADSPHTAEVQFCTVMLPDDESEDRPAMKVTRELPGGTPVIGFILLPE